MAVTRSLIFILLIFVPLILAVIVFIGVYVWKDAKRRDMNAPAWTLISVILPCFVGLGIYLAARYGHSKLHCPACGQNVKESFIVCPHCGAQLKLRCPGCGTPVEPGWKVCPQCAAPLPARTPPLQEEKKDKGLVWVLGICILLPAVLILLLLLFSLAPFGYSGHSSVQTGNTLAEWQADEADGWVLEEEPLQGWLEDCALMEEPGVRVLWQRLYCGEGDDEYQKQVCYIYVYGYSETQLNINISTSLWGNVGMKLNLTGRRDNGAPPMLYYAQVRADKVSGNEPAVYLNGAEQKGCAEKTEDILSTIFDPSPITE